MAKIDKSNFSKDEWRKVKEQRRLEKEKTQQEKINSTIVESKITVNDSRHHTVAFVLGNGTSRKPIKHDALKVHGKTYGCNALYRKHEPDYLVAVDVKMILEINKTGYQNTHEVWTNPNKAFNKMKNFNFFHPSKGWSSGPTALWLASQHGYDKIFILGFDYKGLDNGKVLNNLYADTMNYKKSTDTATFFGNWLRQTKNVIENHKHITYYRVIAPDNYVPEELNKFSNLKHIFIDDFIKMYNLS